MLEEYANQIYDTLGTKADALQFNNSTTNFMRRSRIANDVAMQFEDVNLTLDLNDQDIIKLYDS